MPKSVPLIVYTVEKPTHGYLTVGDRCFISHSQAGAFSGIFCGLVWSTRLTRFDVMPTDGTDNSQVKVEGTSSMWLGPQMRALIRSKSGTGYCLCSHAAILLYET